MKSSQMNHSKTKETSSGLSLFILGALIGVSAMYVLDPQYGKRRRSYIRDKSVRLRNLFNTYADRYSRHLNNKAQGMMYKARKSIQSKVDQADASW